MERPNRHSAAALVATRGLGMHHSIYMHEGMPSGATAHPIGPVRFQHRPASSALDVNWKAHEIGPDPR